MPTLEYQSRALFLGKHWPCCLESGGCIQTEVGASFLPGKFSRFGSAVLTGQGKRATMEDSLQLQLLTKYSSFYRAELVICKVAGFNLLWKYSSQEGCLSRKKLCNSQEVLQRRHPHHGTMRYKRPQGDLKRAHKDAQRKSQYWDGYHSKEWQPANVRQSSTKEEDFSPVSIKPLFSFLILEDQKEGRSGRTRRKKKVGHDTLPPDKSESHG